MESTPVLKVQKGFTLVEMLVVLSIVTILTAIILVNQNSFNKTLLLTDTTYTVALSAREAQTFGLSSRKFGTVQNAGYGLHFDMTVPTKYQIFADTANPYIALHRYNVLCPLGTAGRPDAKPGDCRYSPGQDGLVNEYSFKRGFKIKDFCITPIGSAKVCSSALGGAMPSIDVVFTRPNTSTTITATVNGSYWQGSCAEVVLTDSTGQATKTMTVSQLGQVSVGGSCP